MNSPPSKDDHAPRGWLHFLRRENLTIQRNSSSSTKNSKEFTSRKVHNTTSGGGCPVEHGEAGGGGGCPVEHGGGCPVEHSGNMPASIEEAANYSQSVLYVDQLAEGQVLGTDRTVSTILRGKAEDTSSLSAQKPAACAAATDESSQRWVYPSQQQYYNALRKKGWNTSPQDVPMVLAIHNIVNERGWTEVLKWEELHKNEESQPPRLVKFMGKPKNMSPRAMFNSYVRGYTPPFDRHDWHVERSDGNGGTETTRYILDFYTGSGGAPAGLPNPDSAHTSSPVVSSNPVGMYLDVRPALDSPSAVLDRLQMFGKETFPGVFDNSSKTG